MSAAAPIGARNTDRGDRIVLFIDWFRDLGAELSIGGSSQNRTENLTRMKPVSRRESA